MSKVSVGKPSEGGALEHYVSTAPFEPQAAETLTPEQEAFYRASQWRIMWWKFRRHKIAVVSAVILALLYASALVSEILAPYALGTRDSPAHLCAAARCTCSTRASSCRPVRVRLQHAPEHRDASSASSAWIRPEVQPLRFFCNGRRVRVLGPDRWRPAPGVRGGGGNLLPAGHRPAGARPALAHHHGTRISLTVGLLGILVSFVIGITLGGISGYHGGWIDNSIQRIIEVVRSFPELPLWMALSAALPVTWSPVLIYFGITIILGLLDWPGLARAVRSKFLALREEDFATAAVLMGASPARVIGRHLLPSFTSHLIASLTLSVPSMILGETALSFLGWPAPAHHQLGCAAQRGAEHQRGRALSLADDAGDPGLHRRAGLQLHGRRHARRGGSVQLTARRDGTQPVLVHPALQPARSTADRALRAGLDAVLLRIAGPAQDHHQPAHPGQGLPDRRIHAPLPAPGLDWPNLLGGGTTVLFHGFALERTGYLFALTFTFPGADHHRWPAEAAHQYDEGLDGRAHAAPPALCDLFDHILRFPLPHFRRVKSAEMATMIRDEIEPLGGFVGESITPLYLGGQALTALFFILFQHIHLGMLAFGMVVLQAVIIPRMRRRLLELSRQRQLAARQWQGASPNAWTASSRSRTTPRTTTVGAPELSARRTACSGSASSISSAELFAAPISSRNNLLSQITPLPVLFRRGLPGHRRAPDIGALVAVIAAYKDLPGPVKELIDWDQGGWTPA